MKRRRTPFSAFAPDGAIGAPDGDTLSGFVMGGAGVLGVGDSILDSGFGDGLRIDSVLINCTGHACIGTMYHHGGCITEDSGYTICQAHQCNSVTCSNHMCAGRADCPPTECGAEGLGYVCPGMTKCGPQSVRAHHEGVKLLRQALATQLAFLADADMNEDD